MFEKSKIISKEILPIVWSNLPKLRSSERIFEVNVDKEEITPMDFHDSWDDKGPTLILVKTSNNKIFGAYSPVSWISENVSKFIFNLIFITGILRSRRCIYIFIY